jgi:ribonuclease HI
VAIFVDKALVAQLKFKLDNRCSNNQAEQLAIAKALEVIESIDISETGPCTVTIFTDSRIALDSLKNVSNHDYLIEEIGKRIFILERLNWTIEFSWAKVYIGIYGNELADWLAEEVARSSDRTVAFNRIPRSTLYSEIEDEANQKLQKEWENCTKAAITKQYFPQLQDRLKLKMNINAVFAAMVTGHGKTRAYLHRFKLMEHALCVCNRETKQ